MKIMTLAVAATALIATAGPAYAFTDVENNFLHAVHNKFPQITVSDQEILAATYEDVCGPIRPMTAFDLGGRLGISPLNDTGFVTAMAGSTGLCWQDKH